MARIYDKTLELKPRKADWPVALWKDPDPAQPVWRIEFQFRRDALRTFAIQTAADALALRQGLWDYATGQWLSLRTRDQDANRARWSEAPEWSVIREAQVGSPCSPLVRQRIRNADRLKLLQGFLGYASSLAAYGEEDEMERAFDDVIPDARRYLAERNTDFADITARKRGRLLAV